MFNLKPFLKHALLALSLAFGSAMASPTYHVSVDTSTFSGSGWLNLTFFGLDGAAAATATLTNFSGDFGAAALTDGNVSGDIGTALVIHNDPGLNDLLQSVNFGNRFSFDANFDIGAGDTGTTFGVALIDDGFTTYLGADGNVSQIDLFPGSPDQISTTAGITAVAEASATAVPEPSTMAIFATGLVLLTARKWRRAKA